MFTLLISERLGLELRNPESDTLLIAREFGGGIFAHPTLRSAVKSP
jgi:hypothetical protein